MTAGTKSECCKCPGVAFETLDEQNEAIKTEDVKAIQKSFQLVAASASVQDLGVGFFRL